jgi:methylmalonyl-CoA decarboxylase subunit alpha
MNDRARETNDLRVRIREMGGSEKVAREHEKGKMTCRERISAFFDEGSFVEIGTFAARAGDDDARSSISADGVVTGYGRVGGRLVFASAQDFTVMGGSLGETHAGKICRIMDMAYEMGSPIVSFVDSGGARIDEGVAALSGYGSVFARNVRYSGVIPQISVIMGSCAGGASYSPALTDFIFMVRGTSTMFITGPKVIKAVTGIDTDAEDIGGVKVHMEESGVCHFAYDDDRSSIDGVKALISYLPQNNLESPSSCATDDNPNRMMMPEFDEYDIDGSARFRIKEFIRDLVDDGVVMEYSKGFATNVVTCLGRINGSAVGIVANRRDRIAGALDIDGSDKASRFIRTLDAFNIPLVTLVDVPGFMVDRDQEKRGIIRHGAKLLYAYGEATVPKVTVILKKAYGGAYVAMCSKETGADMVFAWPGSEIAVMGAPGAVDILYRHEIESAEDPVVRRRELEDEYSARFMSPLMAAGRGYVDDIIAPSTTRVRVAEALQMLWSKRDIRPDRKHGNMPL